jgi:hypothetical protein
MQRDLFCAAASTQPFDSSQLMTKVKHATHEWTLWVVAVSCALHATEEYLSGWQIWAVNALGIAMPTSRFVIGNLVLVVMACVLARVGWKLPTLSLIIPAATLVNAIFFHILPTVVQKRISPGIYTASILYVPFSIWAIFGSWRDGVRVRSIGLAVLLGTLMMLMVVLLARSLSV